MLKFTAITGGLFFVAAVILAFFSPAKTGIFVMAYLLSFIFTGSNLLVMRKVDLEDQNRFFKIFGWSLAIRFVMVIGTIVLALKLINNHQIFFTISFIISYICHSVIEIIFLNKILEIDTK